jgi:hypothetical protein
MNAEIIDIVIELKEFFDPIAKKLGMIELPILKHTYMDYSFAYLQKEIGIEINIDLSYFFIYLLVFKPKDEKVPIGYEDEFGNPQLVYIKDALKKIEIDNSKKTKELQKLGGNYKNCMSMANIYAALLEDNWEMIKLKANIIFQKERRISGPKLRFITIN